MNYFFALMICFAMTGLSANEENARWLLICDFNVALYLALAWFLGFRRKSREEQSAAALQLRITDAVLEIDSLEHLLREAYHHPDTPACIRERIRKALVPAPRCP
ncbi:hypothetical protein C4K10_1898 [Pseudomonas chlororaphis subsp. aureofaciens]|uniref:hypothetical protein n=1 Tax=Pseudomonas chlororaphis TaxID=587753 RepID=UPI00086506BC|nr:hypothetical protein [Pseudomonas chlororaphis]AZE10188.1 hypothetical protein C4K10_1898 [Pseudomonas chlororaphis subsp. aureofaciens]BAV74124.1 TPR repeats protein [Pseudomonas chlororaphis subsp. aurantiaca]